MSPIIDQNHENCRKLAERNHWFRVWLELNCILFSSENVNYTINDRFKSEREIVDGQLTKITLKLEIF